MSTVTGTTSRSTGAEDPFRLGWRYVTRRYPDGSETVDQVPLTEEDVLHPQADDFIVLSHGHELDCWYLSSVFRAQVADDPTAVVTCDLRMAWDDPAIRPLGPDITVIFGVHEERDWRTFDVAEEGVRPTLLVEVTSESTRRNDLGIKRTYYHRLRIPYYIIADADDDAPGRPIRLIGLRHAPADFVEMPLDPRGWLWLEPLGIWLGVGNGRLVCYDKEGKEIGDYTQISRAYYVELEARRAAEERAVTAEQRASAAEERATTAERRATAEAEARAMLEERLRALEAEVRRRNGNNSN